MGGPFLSTITILTGTPHPPPSGAECGYLEKGEVKAGGQGRTGSLLYKQAYRVCPGPSSHLADFIS